MFMECKYVKTIKIPDINANDSMYSLIIGEVIHIHARKDVVVNKHHHLLPHRFFCLKT